MNIKKLFYTVAVLAVLAVTATAFGYQSDLDSWRIQETGVDAWRIDNINYDFLPGTDSAHAIGSATYAVEDVFADQITLNGASITSWGSVVSPFDDSGTTITATAAPTKFIFTISSGTLLVTILDTDDITGVTNDQTIDMSTNNKVIFGDNSDTFTIEFDATDTILQSSDGAIVFNSSQADGEVHFKVENDSDDYIAIQTNSNIPTITTIGSCDLEILSSSGEITFGNENLTTTGTLDCGALTASSVAGIDSITGTTHGDALNWSTDDQLTFASNDEASTICAYGFDDKDGILSLIADTADDNGDTWLIESDESTNSLIIQNDTSGSQVAKLTGTTAGSWTMGGDVFTFGDGEYLTNAEDDTIKLCSNDNDVVFEINSLKNEGTASIVMASDIDTDAGDTWRIQASASETFIIANDTAIADTFVAKLTVAGTDGDISTTGDIEIIDDMDLVFGTNSDWKIQYDEDTDNQLIFITAGTAAVAVTDPLFEVLVGATPTADQQVFGIAKGTQVSNTALLTVDEDGDVVITGNTTMTGDLDIDGNDLTSAADLLITPAGTEVHIDGGLAVGDTTAVGDNNLKVVGTSLLVGEVTLTANIDIDGGGITCPADLLITPTGSEVHINGGLAVGDTTAVGDNNFKVVGTSDLVGVTTCTAKIDLNNILDIDTAVADPITVTTSLQTASSGITIEMDGADVSAQQYGLEIEYKDDAQANCDFIICKDDADVAPATLFTVDHAGIVTAAGGLTVSAGSVTLPAGTVSAADCAAAAKRFVITMAIADLSAASKLYVLPPKCTVVTAYTVVDTAITSANAVIELHKNGAAMTSGTITITADDAQGTVDTCTPSTNNTFNGTSDYLDVDNLGASTNASKCILTLHCTSTD